ncbi:unnamed protein product [Lymnaea stagnalis]|uniref:Uncharacterized protein n=1 Tax=Lymnaea stagnalis TaxID=6523 RepID=A0AAV2ILI0_LYMST
MAGISRSRTSYDFHPNDPNSVFNDVDYPPVSTPRDMSPSRMLRPATSRSLWGPGERQSRSATRSLTPAHTQASAGRHHRPPTRSFTPGFEEAVSTNMNDPQPEVDENPYTQPMDPINRQHYFKLWRRNPPQPQKPIYREGRAGAGWRHIKACNNSSGSHLVFIDGAVKAEENFFYPPASMFEPLDLPRFVLPPSAPNENSPTRVPYTYRGIARDTRSQDRARQGFKTWYYQKKPVDCYDIWWSKH